MPQRLPEPPDAVKRLARMVALRTLSPAALEALAPHVQWLRVGAGEALFVEGDNADAAYFVLRGRVRVLQQLPDGSERLLGEGGAGDPIGEIGLLADAPRTARVQAVRDTDVARIDRATFEAMLRDHPEAMLPLVQVVSARLVSALQGDPSPARRVATLGIVVDRAANEARGVADALIDALTNYIELLQLEIRAGSDHGATRMAEVIDQHEALGTLAVLDIDVAAPEASLALRQIDALVVVTSPSHAPGSRGVRALLGTLEGSECAPRRIVVLVQPPHRARPSGTARQIEGFDAHFHVRAGDTEHVARVARHLLGRSIGLVLSGGGARAMAHVGAYRALRESGVPIDHVAGSSIGGVIAAQVAAGWSLNELSTRNQAEWPAANIGRRLTVPLLSILSPTRARQMLDRMFQDADLEDLWLPCFVTAVDLSRCRLAICEKGPLRTWALATQAPPGLWPPVIGEDRALYVDGSLIDNLPVLPMRDRGARHVIAIDVSRRRPFEPGPEVSTTPTPMQHLRNLSRKPEERPRAAFPNLIQVLQRSALVTSIEAHERSKAASDLYVEPPVSETTLGDYSRVGDLMQCGYDATVEALAGSAALVESWHRHTARH